MKLGKLLREAGLSDELKKDLAEYEITGICSDSRRVRAGEIFVALRGLHYDGARFVAQALGRGAAFVLCEQPLEGKNTMVVEDARAALAKLLDAWYGHPARELSLIGITGTNGKTSTAYMLFEILRAAGHSTGLIGTVECRCNDTVLHAQNPQTLANMTTPDPAELYFLLSEMKRMGAKYVVMEVTSHALAFQKVEPLYFHRAVFTNLTPEHLDLHGDMEAYFLEKRKLFARCEGAVVSSLATYGKRLAAGLECPVNELCREDLDDIVYRDVDGVSFSVGRCGAPKLHLTVPVPGRFAVENAALAALSAYSLGVPDGVIQGALATFSGVRGRMERVAPNPLGITVFLDYAHTPDALEKLLLSVRDFSTSEQRICLLFGCGGERDHSKRKEMGRIGSRLSDFLVLTSDNCRGESADAILEEILKGVDKEKPYCVIRDREKAIHYAVEHARAGDILILAGKGHEEYEIRGTQRLPFSERRIVEKAIEKRVRAAQNAN